MTKYPHSKGRGAVRSPRIRKIWRSNCPILVPIVPKWVLLAVRQVTKGGLNLRFGLCEINT